MSKEKLEPKKPEFNLDKKFIDSGGEVLNWYPAGRPARWKCGIDKNGNFIDPQEAIHYKNANDEWEAGNPDEELLEEIKRWRSDWNEPV